MPRMITTCAPVQPNRAIRTCVTRPEKPGPVISGPEAVCRLLRGAKGADRESFYAIHLDTQNKVLGVEEVAKGTLTETVTSGRELFKSALATNAAAMIVAHNHPSGNATPSTADVRATQALARAGKILGVPLRDHVIVAEGGCTSLRETMSEQIDFHGPQLAGSGRTAMLWAAGATVVLIGALWWVGRLT